MQRALFHKLFFYIRNTHSLGVQGDNKLFYRKSTAFMFRHGYRLKLAVTVTWNGNDRFSMFGLDSLRIAAVALISTVITSYGVLFIPQMDIHFAFKHLLQYLGMQLLQKLAHIGFGLELAKELLA